MQEVRAVFEKKGCSIYMSHLDLVRCVARASRRAGIPVWYTEGFNPHPFFTFALPLSLGQSSVCETMDFRLVAEMPFDEVVTRFNQCMPAGIRVLSADAPVMKHTAIVWARYELVFSLEGLSGGEIAGRLSSLMEQEDIPAQKKTKSKQLRTINLKPWVKEYGVTSRGEEAVLDIVLPAGCVDNINPALLSQSVARFLASDDFTMSITRTAVYDGEMTLFK